jgi:hypothetical protein
MFQAFVEVVQADVLSYPDDPTDYPTLHRVNVGDPTSSAAHAAIALAAHLDSKRSDVADELLNRWGRKYGDVTNGSVTCTLATDLHNNGHASAQMIPLRVGIECVTVVTV